MDADGFDRLAKTVSGTGSRRGLVRLLSALPLGVLLTAVLGHGPNASAKTRKKPQTDDDHGSSHRHHRRTARNRHHPGRDKQPAGKQAKSAGLRPINVWMYNPGPNSVTVGHGDFQDNVLNFVCRGINSGVIIPPGVRKRFASQDPDAYVIVNGKYAFEFWNPFAKVPRVSAAVNGISITGRGYFCPPRGTTMLSCTPLNVDRSVNVTIDGGCA